MKWFRSNIKHGSRLALLALALQFGLSFGHFHAGAAQALLGVQPAAAHANISIALAAPDVIDQSASLPASDHYFDHHPGENCVICAVLTMASTAVSATPPPVLLPRAADFRHLITDAEFVHLNLVGVAFQPRAPPAS